MTVTQAALNFFRVPKPGEAVAGWHVAPVVDVVAYAFSWLLILVPLSLAGDAHPKDYLALWAFGITTSFLHRHFTMPYVYLDGAVFQTHKTRFTLIPAVLFCGFIASVALHYKRIPARFVTSLDIATLVACVAVVVHVWWRDKREERFNNTQLISAALPFVTATVLGVTGHLAEHHTQVVVVVAAAAAFAAFLCGGTRLLLIVVGIVLVGVALHVGVGPLHSDRIRGQVVVGAVAMLAALWNIWHTAAQKVGIFRVYNAKSAAPVEKKVPLWVDRLLVLGWFPLLAALLVTRERETILTQGKVVKVWLEPIVDGVAAFSVVLVPVGVLCVIASIGCFLFYEHRATGLKSAPRLVMALGMTGLSASFLFLSPLKCYVAYGFSHAIEYVVFVWAYQRKRYATPHAPPPLLQRLLRYSWLFYGIFTFLIAGFYFYVEFGERFGFFDGKIKLLGYKIGLWLYAWAIWHSLAHFYFDGFLWKMRAPTVRAHL